MRRVVYLSGRIAGLTYDEAVAKRDAATKMLNERNWDVLDPMRGKEILSTLAVIDEVESKKLLGGATDAAIVQRDFDDVRRADAIIVLSGDEPSWGTAYEWAIAHFHFQKPVVVVCSKDSPTRIHPWCLSMSSGFFETVEEAILFIDTWLDRGYQLEEYRERAYSKEVEHAIRGY
jgi:nucleoside 2-deoxyribosyltransferase